jgi:hypothetical protein
MKLHQLATQPVITRQAGQVCAPAHPVSRPRRFIGGPCKVLRREVVAAPTSRPGSDVDAASPPRQPPQPYRVTQETVDDNKSFHRSQVKEWDYIIDPAWVGG